MDFQFDDQWCGDVGKGSTLISDCIIDISLNGIRIVANNKIGAHSLKIKKK